MQTDIVAVSTKREAVGLVAIAASYISMKHPALDERAVLVIIKSAIRPSDATV